jgi:hypothetical protein
MLKNALLALSLLINGAVAYLYYFPKVDSGPRMSCEQARRDAENKLATDAFARANGGSFAKTHAFLVNSGYGLRNVDDEGGSLTFVYVATSYSASCGIHLPGFGGGIVRVGTDAKAGSLITRIF